MTKKYLADPFNALYLYQDNFTISDRPEIQEIDEYARDLEERARMRSSRRDDDLSRSDCIEGDFNLDYIVFEFAYNRLAYVRNGLLLAKLKFLKLYKNFGNGTFASFCREQLKITRWQVNDNIKAARVCMELIYAGFEILPTNISQAIALASLVGDELVNAWRSVIESIEPDRITHKSIKSFLFPPTEQDLPTTTIKVPPTLHESIHAEAAERGMSIVDLIRTMFEFFISGGDSHLFGVEDARSHRDSAKRRSSKTTGKALLSVPTTPLKDDVNNIDYAEKERIWREDLAALTAESGAI